MPFQAGLGDEIPWYDRYDTEVTNRAAQILGAIDVSELQSLGSAAIGMNKTSLGDIVESRVRVKGKKRRRILQ